MRTFPYGSKDAAKQKALEIKCSDIRNVVNGFQYPHNSDNCGLLGKQLASVVELAKDAQLINDELKD